MLPRPDVARNILTGNTARDGAGINCHETDSLEVRDCVLRGNTADNRGGGIMTTAVGTVPWVRLTNCTLYENQAQIMIIPPGGGGAYAAAGALEIVNTIVAANFGGGLCCPQDTPSASIASDYCDIWENGWDYYGCAAGPHSFGLDPQFCPVTPPAADPPRDDAVSPWFCIMETSPCNGTGRGGDDIGAGWVGCYSLDDVVFYDNFSDQADDGWVAEETWPQQVEVEDGEYSLNSIGDAAGSYVGDLNVEDLELTVWVRPEETLLGGATSVGFRLDPQTRDRYEMTIETELQRGSLVRWQGDVGCIMAEFDCPVVADAWHRLVVRAPQARLAAFWTPPLSPPITLFDLEDPEPLPAGTIRLGVAWRSAPVDRGAQHTHFDRVMVRDASASGLDETVRDPEPAGFTPTVRVTPNPSRGTVAFLLPASSPGARLELFDVQGRLVRSLGRELSNPAAPTTLVWDGRDEAGRVVAAGVYAWRIPTPAGAGADKANARGRVTILR